MAAIEEGAAWMLHKSARISQMFVVPSWMLLDDVRLKSFPANCKILGRFVSSTSGALAACEGWLLRAAVNGISGGYAPSSFMTSY
jgi:hypothetical protein